MRFEWGNQNQPIESGLAEVTLRTSDVLSGVRFPHWIRLLSSSRGAIPIKHWPEVVRLTVQAAWNQLIYLEEERQLSSRLETHSMRAPVIITGFPRSGTTMLHHLLAQDPGMRHPTTLQVFNPHTFFFMENQLEGRRAALARWLYGFWVRAMWRSPRASWSRRSDGLATGVQSPFEDEYVLLSLGMSRYIVYTFFTSLHEVSQQRYSSLRELSRGELDEWKSGWTHFLNKLSLRYDGARLLLKSPTHMARLPILMEVFPTAHVVHVHRHPFELYPSWCHLVRTYADHGISENGWLRAFLKTYRRLFVPFLEDHELVPQGQLGFVRYDRLVSSPLAELERLYSELNLSGFEQAADRFRQRLWETQEYRTNRYRELLPYERRTILEELGPILDFLGYSSE